MNDYTKLAIHASHEAGRLIMKSFGKRALITIRQKKQSIATNVDVATEQMIRTLIYQQFPNHAILGEERGRSKKSSDYLWVVDPIDGTTNYVMGSPYFGVMVSLVHRDDILASAIYLPVFHKTLYAEKGKGAFLDGKRVRVNQTKELKKSIVNLSAMHKREPMQTILAGFLHLFPKVRNVRLFGSAAIGYYFLLTGGIEATAISGPTTLWDVVAGVLLTREAGGVVTDWQGKPWTVKSPDVVASNGKIHTSLIKELQRLE